MRNNLFLIICSLEGTYEGLSTEERRRLQTQLAESKGDNNYYHSAVRWMLRQACLQARREMEHCSQGWSQEK